MSGWIWLAPVASLLGAGLAYVGAWLGTRQRQQFRRPRAEAAVLLEDDESNEGADEQGDQP